MAKLIKTFLILLLICTSLSFINSLDIKTQDKTRFTFVDKIDSIQFQYQGKSVTIVPEAGSCSTDCLFEFKDYVTHWDAQTFIYKYTSNGKVLTKTNSFDKFGYIESIASPKTSGSNQTFTAYFLQVTPSLVKSFSAKINGVSYENEDLSLGLVDENDYTKYTITFPPGTGKIDIVYDKKPMSINYAAPEITSSTFDGESVVTLVGDNFANVKEQVTVSLDGTALAPEAIVSADYQKVVFNFAPKITGEHSVAVSVNGISSAKPLAFQIKPVVTAISSVPNKGGKVTLTGKFLNTDKGDGVTKSVVKILVGTTECANPVNPEAGVFTSLVCEMPAGNNDNLDVVVEIDSIKSESAVKFSYGFPTIASITQKDNVFVITGSCLGELATSEVIIDGGAPIKPSAISDDETQVTVTLPDGATNGKLQVKISDTKTSIPFDLKITPIVKSITQAATRGSNILITGQFLDPTKALVVDIADEGFSCTDIAQTPETDKGTSITCHAPAGVGANHTLIISIDGQTVEAVFSYSAPVIDSIGQDFGYGIIKGSNFGRSSSDVNVYFFGEIVPKTVDDHDFIQFHIPESSNPGDLYIIVGGQQSNTVNFAIQTLISGHDPISTAGGQLVIRGNFFNTSGTTLVKVGNTDCTDPQINEDRTVLTCTLPNGSGRNSKITVTNDGVEISNPSNILFSYAPPTITSVSKITKEGGAITIEGASFNVPVQVNVGEYICNEPVVENYGRITCTLDPIKDNYENSSPYTLLVNVNELTATQEVQVEGVNKEDSRIRWLVPAIVIPCFFGLVTIAIVTVFLVKRHKNKQGSNKK